MVVAKEIRHFLRKKIPMKNSQPSKNVTFRLQQNVIYAAKYFSDRINVLGIIEICHKTIIRAGS